MCCCIPHVSQAEEYKNLSSKEKRQLRNKLSARAFRNRRKDYIGELEDHIKDRDRLIEAIRNELKNARGERDDLRYVRSARGGGYPLMSRLQSRDQCP